MAIGLLCLSTFVGVDLRAQDEDKVTYDDHIQAIFRQRCSSCHSPDRRNGGLDVTTYITLMQGGGSGEVIEAGDLDFSYLYTLVTHQDEPVMPPGQKIPDNEIALIAKWIEGGALENKGSKAVIKKKKIDMSVVENPLERPEVQPMPGRTILETQVEATLPPNVDAIAVSPWAPVIALGTQKQVLLYHLPTQRLIGVIPFPTGQVNSVRFSRNGQWLAIGGGKGGFLGNVLLWDVVKAEPVATVGAELDAVLACDISPDHTMVALGGPQRVVRAYSVDSGELLYELTKHTEWITAIEFSPDGALLATGDRNGGLETWEAMTGRSYLTLAGHTSAITAISWRSDSNLVASSSEDTTVRLWELNGGSQVKSWGAHAGGTLAVQFAADGRLISCGRDNLVKLWDQQGNAIAQFTGLSDVATDLCFCNETNRVVAGAYGGQVNVWQVEDTSLLGSLTTLPRPLGEQVETAQRKFAESQAALQAVQTSYDSLKLTHDQLRAELTELQQQRASSAQNMATLQSLVNSTQSQAAEADSSRTAIEQQLSHNQAAIPAIEESLAKLKEVADKLPKEATLHQTLASLNSDLESMKAQAVELKSVLDQVMSKSTEAEKVISKTATEISEVEAKLASLDEQITALNARIEPAKQNVDSVATELAAVAETHRQTTEDLEYWQAEVAFAQQLRQLMNELDQSVKLADSKQVALDEIQQQLLQIQNRFDEARKELSEAESASNEIQNKIDDIKLPVSNKSNKNESAEDTE